MKVLKFLAWYLPVLVLAFIAGYGLTALVLLLTHARP